MKVGSGVDKVEAEPVTLEMVESSVKCAKKPITEAKCQLVFFNLLMLWAKTETGAADGARFVRELFQTVRCDEFHNMRYVREAYAERMDLEELRQVVVDDEKESRSATCVFDHYGEWTRRELVKSLSLSNKAKYYAFHRPVELFATMMTVSGWAAYRIARMRGTSRK